MRQAAAALLLALAAGCASTPPTRSVTIDSEPRGARVFVAYGANEGQAKAKEFLGVTPFEWHPETDGDSLKMPHIILYSMAVRPVAVFSAEPAGEVTNLYAKRQVFHGGAFGQSPDKIPAGLFFDLTKP